MSKPDILSRIERDEELSDKEGQESPWTQTGDGQEPPQAPEEMDEADEASGDETPMEAAPGGSQEEVAVPGDLPFVGKEMLAPWTKAPRSTVSLHSKRNGCAWSDESHGEKQAKPAGGSEVVGLPETFLPAVEGRETNMLGSEELGAEVGGGGWSCSACPGGTEESGQPWGMDFEWEGWAGRWEVLEKDTDQTELGAAEMWEEPWSRALSRRIEELGGLKAPQEKLGRCCSVGNLTWSPSGSLGVGLEERKRDTEGHLWDSCSVTWSFSPVWILPWGQGSGSAVGVGAGMRCLCLCQGWERGQGSLWDRGAAKS